MKSTVAKHIQSTTLFPRFSTHVVKTTLKDLVSIEMSLFLPSRNASAEEQKIASVTSQLLDAGTKKRSKEVLRKLLEERGITISFNTDPKWLSVHIQTLRDDVPTAFSLLGEMLHTPALKRNEVDLIKKRMFAELENAKSSTGSSANRALRSLIFEKGHAAFAPTVEEEQRLATKLSAKEVVQFHKQAYGKDGGFVVAVGDVDAEVLNASVSKAFQKLKAKDHVYVPSFNKKKIESNRKILSMKDQASVDLRVGHAVPFSRKDPRYIPLMVLMDMLGGGFSAHLMQTVREREGLTYGIYAGLQGFNDGNDGWWQISGTFAPQLFKKGEEVVRREVKEFLAHGITEDAVRRKKEEILGTYKIGLATSRGLASTVLYGLEEDLGVVYVDTFIDDVEKVTLADIEKARELIDLPNASFVAAGSIDQKGDPL